MTTTSKTSLKLAVFAATLILLGNLMISAANLTWNTGAGDWDSTTANWNPGPTTYSDGGVDNVLFEDVTGSGGTITVTDIGGSGGVTPQSTSVDGTLNYTFSGNSILGGPLSKSGTGTLNLANSSNNFSAIDLSGGVLQFSNAGQLGASTSTLTFSEDAILLYDTTGAPTTLANPIVIADGKTAIIDLDHNASGVWDISGQITGGTTANPVNLILRELNLGGGSFDDVRLSNASNSFIGTLTIRDRAEFNWDGVDGVFGDPSNAIIMTGSFPNMRLNGNTLLRDISGGRFLNGTLAGVVSGSIEILGAGTVELTNTGNTLTSAAIGQNSANVILRVSDPGHLGSPGQVQFGGQEANFVIAGTPTADFPARLFIENNGSRFSKFTVEDPAAVINWTGDVFTRQTDQDNLAKWGDGTLNLSSFAVTGTLALNVEEGTLNLNDTTPGTNIFGPIVVKSGATLGGTGLVDLDAAGSVTVNAGGTLNPGASIGTLTVDGDITLEDGAVFEVEINDVAAGDYDRLVVTSGTISLVAGSELAIDAGSFSASAFDTAFILDNQTGAPIAGTFQYAEGDLVGTFGGKQWIITYAADTGISSTGGDDIALVAIPEPTTAAITLLFALCSMFCRRPRRT